MGTHHTIPDGQDNASGTRLNISADNSSNHQFGQFYVGLRSSGGLINLGRFHNTSSDRRVLHQNTGSGAGSTLGKLQFTAYSLGGGGPTWHNAAAVAAVFEDNPSTNTAPGTLEFRTMESYGADISNPRNRMSVHGGTKAGDVTIWSGSLELKGADGDMKGGVSGSATSTGSFGRVEVFDKIHSKRGSSGASIHVSADEGVFENSANAGISILSGTSNEGAVYFGDSGDNDIGRIRYDHSDNTMDLVVVGIRMTLDTNSRVFPSTRGLGTSNTVFGK